MGASSAFSRFSSSIAAASTSSSYAEYEPSESSSESSDDDVGFESSSASRESESESSEEARCGTQLSNLAILGDSRKKGVSPSPMSTVSRSDGGASGSNPSTVSDPLRSTAYLDLLFVASSLL